jgi:hypothetical protein
MCTVMGDIAEDCRAAGHCMWSKKLGELWMLQSLLLTSSSFTTLKCHTPGNASLSNSTFNQGQQNAFKYLLIDPRTGPASFQQPSLAIVVTSGTSCRPATPCCSAPPASTSPPVQIGFVKVPNRICQEASKPGPRCPWLCVVVLAVQGPRSPASRAAIIAWARMLLHSAGRHITSCTNRI